MKRYNNVVCKKKSKKFFERLLSFIAGFDRFLLRNLKISYELLSRGIFTENQCLVMALTLLASIICLVLFKSKPKNKHRTAFSDQPIFFVGTLKQP
jgi:hypothetical protein